MVEFSQQIDLSFQVFYFVRFINSFFFINFYRYLLSQFLLDSHSHNSISPFTQFPKNLILFHLFFPFNRDIEIEDRRFAGDNLFLLLLRLHFFLLHFVNIVWFDVVLHHCIYELCVYSLGVLLLFLQRTLRSLMARRSTICDTK